jgi:hypothetical protein
MKRYLTALNDWLDHRTGVPTAVRTFLYEDIPASSGWHQVLGSVAARWQSKLIRGANRRYASLRCTRMTYVLSVAANRNLDLAATLPSELANVVRLCLRAPGYSVSQELAAIWISEGIDSIVFPSITGAGRNVAVYLANAAAGSVVVRNRAEVLAALRRPRAGKRDR